MLTLLYDRAFLKMGQEKNMRIAYFVVNNIYMDKKKIIKAIQHYLIPMNIVISPLYTNNKGF